MKISTDELLALHHNFKSVANAAREDERGSALQALLELKRGLIQTLAQFREGLVKSGSTSVPVQEVLDMLSDLDPRPKPVSDEQIALAKRYPTMFKGGPESDATRQRNSEGAIFYGKPVEEGK